MSDYTTALERHLTDKTLDAQLAKLSRDDLTKLARIGFLDGLVGTEISGENVTSWRDAAPVAKRVFAMVEDDFDAECRANEFERGADVAERRRNAA